MATYVIQVIVQTGGANAQLASLRSGLNQTAAAGTNLQGVLARLVGVAALRSVVQLADQYTIIQNRLKTVAPLQHQLSLAMETTFDIAQRNRVAWADLANTYSRISRSTEQLFLTTSQVADITDTLTKAIKLSGASTSETTSVLRQFGQALSKGKLDGDEFRSIMENSVEVGNLLTKSLGVTRGELMALSKAGKLTNAVIIRAFQEGRREIVDKFGRAIPTVAERFEQLRNQAILWAGTVASQSPILQAFGAALGIVANHFDTLATTVLHLAEVLTVVLVARAIPAAIAAMNALTVAMIANPYLALAAGIAAAAIAISELAVSYDEMTEAEKRRRAAIGPEDAFLRLSKETPEFERNMIGIDAARNLEQVNAQIREAIRLGPSLSGIWDRLTSQLQGWRQGLVTIADTNVKVLTQVILGFTEATIKNTEAAVEAAEKWRALKKEYEGLAGGVDPVLQRLFELRDAQDLLNRSVAAGIVTTKEAARVYELYRQERTDAPRVTSGGLEGLSRDLSEREFGGGPRASDTLGAQAFERDLLLGGAGATAADRRALNQQFGERGDRIAQAQLDLLDDLRSKEEERENRLIALNLLLADGAINQEQYAEGIKRIGEESAKSAERLDQVWVTAISNVEDAFANFLATGEFSFHKFTEALLQDMARLVAKQAILGLVGAAFGSGGGDVFSQGAALLGQTPGRANGGMVPTSRIPGRSGIDSQFAAFRVSPNERVVVETPGQQRRRSPASAAPVVVQVINRDDPRAVVALGSTPAAVRTQVDNRRRYPSAPGSTK